MDKHGKPLRSFDHAFVGIDNLIPGRATCASGDGSKNANEDSPVQKDADSTQTPVPQMIATMGNGADIEV